MAPQESEEARSETASPSTLTGSPQNQSLKELSKHLHEFDLNNSQAKQSSKTKSSATSSKTMSVASAEDVSMVEVMTPPKIPEEPKDGEKEEPKYGKEGLTRFEIELEFVQSLANPTYLSHLANSTNPAYFTDPAFVNYLEYLQYWSHPTYAKYLHYPGATLKHLELLQQEAFRKEIGRPEVMARLITEGVAAGLRGPGFGGADGLGGSGGGGAGGGGAGGGGAGGAGGAGAAGGGGTGGGQGGGQGDDGQAQAQGSSAQGTPNPS